MKILSGLVVALLLVCAYLFFFPVVKPGTVVVSTDFMDSLYTVANLPNDTIRDTTYVPKYVEVPVKVPVPVSVKDSVSFYKDTTETDDILIVVSDSVKGKILNRGVTYSLKVPRYITTTVKDFVPVPIPCPNKDPAHNKYVQVGIGWGWSAGGGVIHGRYRLGAEVVGFKSSTAFLIKGSLDF